MESQNHGVFLWDIEELKLLVASLILSVLNLFIVNKFRDILNLTLTNGKLDIKRFFFQTRMCYLVIRYVDFL